MNEHEIGLFLAITFSWKFRFRLVISRFPKSLHSYSRLNRRFSARSDCAKWLREVTTESVPRNHARISNLHFWSGFVATRYDWWNLSLNCSLSNFLLIWRELEYYLPAKLDWISHVSSIRMFCWRCGPEIRSAEKTGQIRILACHSNLESLEILMPTWFRRGKFGVSGRTTFEVRTETERGLFF